MATHDNKTSRRALLGAAVAAPAFLGTITAAGMAEAKAAQDGEIIAAWERWCAITRRWNEPWGPISYEEEDRRSRIHSDELSRVETIIQHAEAHTSKGVEIQLWVAFVHTNCDEGEEKALADGNHEAVFAKLRDLDFNAQMIVRAILALRRMEA